MPKRALVLLATAVVASGCSTDDCAMLAGSTTCPVGCVFNEAQVCVPESQTQNQSSSPASNTSTIGSVGAKPNGAHFSLDCAPFNVPAFANSDCLYSHFRGDDLAPNGIVNCTAKLADRNGLVIGDSTRVQFMAEAGAMSPSAWTPPYDSTKPVYDQVDLGHAVGYLEVFGSPLPGDVEPFAGEPYVEYDFGCGMRRANPRDGYVTVIAVVKGEEGFVDVNRNGKYDPGEPFVDEGEPYIDANDNGQYDPGEWFLDVNGDGRWTPPNGKWDSDTTLWTQTRVLYTGLPAYLKDSSGNEMLSRFYPGDIFAEPTSLPVPFPGITPPAPPFLVHFGPPATSQDYSVFLTDGRLNPLASNTQYSVQSLVGKVVTRLTGPDFTANLLGSSFRLLYCDSPYGDNCFDGPVEYGCRTSPCYVVPDVGLCRRHGCAGLITGNHGMVTITGQPYERGGTDEQTHIGDDAAVFSTTIDGITNSMLLRGQCVP